MSDDKKEKIVVIIESVSIISDHSPSSIPNDSVPIPDDYKFTNYGVDIDEFLKKGGNIIKSESLRDSH